jgi:hypothetical protein
MTDEEMVEAYFNVLSQHLPVQTGGEEFEVRIIGTLVNTSVTYLLNTSWTQHHLGRIT